MNKIHTSPRGFPFDELTLKELQDLSVPAINALGALVPDNSRIVGVDRYFGGVQNPDGSISLVTNYTDGFIRWNGELLPFKGGQSDGDFSIMEEVQDRTFNVGTEPDPLLEDHPAYVRRWAEVGVIAGAESTHPMGSLSRAPRFLTYLAKGSVFVGMVVPMVAKNGGVAGSVVSVTFDEALPTSAYMIFSNFYRYNSTAQGNFEYDVFERTTLGFKVRLRNITQAVGNLSFQYLIVPMDQLLKAEIFNP